jgi:urease accessory protein
MQPNHNNTQKNKLEKSNPSYQPQRIEAVSSIRKTDIPLTAPHTTSGKERPDAKLALKFDHDHGRTRLARRDHFGQLYVQKPFYPEGPDVCHVVLVHPPGGVVGGDWLEISQHVGAASMVQTTTPGAAKWYKANGHISHQNISLNVEAGGTLEWLPQETIFFDQARVELDHTVTLAQNATYIGCEIFCFGRTAHGESFNQGLIRQRMNIRRNNKLIWHEQLQLAGGSQAMKSQLILADKTVCATLIVVSDTVCSNPLINTLREDAGKIANGIGQMGISQTKSVLVARYLGDSSEIARNIMLSIWGGLRPALIGRKAEVPRMWNT